MLSTGLSTSQPSQSTRPSLSKCSEEEFLDDVCSFLRANRGQAIERADFPDAILNGSQLDIFALYKETATRGGYKYVPKTFIDRALSVSNADRCAEFFFQFKRGLYGSVIPLLI